MSALLLARFTLREATRKKAVLGGVVLTLIFLLLYGTGTFFFFRDVARINSLSPAMNKAVTGELLLAGLYFVDFIGALLAIFSSVGTISSEIEQGTLHAIVPKPLRRWEVVVGKWLGYAVMITIYVVVTALAAIAIVYVQSGYHPPHLETGLGVMVLHALLLLSLSMLGTSALSTVANGIIVFMLYALGLAGGRLEQLGSLIHNQTLTNIGVITSLIIPSDVLWRLTSSLMGAGGLISNTGAAVSGLFSVVDPPSSWMIAYAAVYASVALVAAVLVFERRDL